MKNYKNISKIIIVAIAYFSFACSSVDGEYNEELPGSKCEKTGSKTECVLDDCEGTLNCDKDGFWSECTCSNLGTGGSGSSSGGSDNSSGGNDTSTGSNDNSGGVENTGGNDNPAGGSNDNTGGNDNPSGGSGTGGNEGCVPKTCDEWKDEILNNENKHPDAGACGSTDDGCGGELVCSCNEGQTCGKEYYMSKDSTIQGNTVENICGGGCFKFTQSYYRHYCNDVDGSTLFVCDVDLSFEENPPSPVPGYECRQYFGSWTESVQYGYCCTEL